MPEFNYTGIIETKDGKDEKTWSNLKSAQAAAGKLSKAGAKVTLFEVAKDGTERKLGVYANGKMSKPKGKSGISPEEFCDLLGCREGTNRRTLASYLAKNMNQFVSAFDLHIALYGESNASSAGAMKMVMAGLLKMLEKEKLTKRFDVLMERRDGKTYYQLAGDLVLQPALHFGAGIRRVQAPQRFGHREGGGVHQRIAFEAIRQRLQKRRGGGVVGVPVLPHARRVGACEGA